MMNDIHLDQLLDGFCTGTINRQQVSDFFDAHEASNSENAIQQHQAAIRAVEQYNILLQVQQVHLTFLQKEKKHVAKVKTINTKVYMLRIAASVVLLLACWFLFQYTTSSGQKMYSRLHSVYTISEMRGSETAATSGLVNAFRAGKYEQTIALFKQVSNPGNRELFFTAVSYLETNQPVPAISYFEQITQVNRDSKTLLYQDETDYYHALTLLKVKQYEKAAMLLQKIQADKNHTYHGRISQWMIWKIKWLAH